MPEVAELPLQDETRLSLAAPSDSSAGLSGLAIGLIVGGAFVACVAAAFLAWCVVRRRREKEKVSFDQYLASEGKQEMAAPSREPATFSL